MTPPSIFRNLLDLIGGFLKSKAYGYVEFDLNEAKNLFGLLLFSPLMGIPLLPASIALELLPHAESDLARAVDRMFTLDDPWGLIGGRFDVE